MHDERLIADFVVDVLAELEHQEELWGIQRHPTGFGTTEYKTLADQFRKITDDNTDRGLVTYADIILEETYEAFAEEDVDKAYVELVQAAACIASAARRVRLHGLD